MFHKQQAEDELNISSERDGFRLLFGLSGRGEHNIRDYGTVSVKLIDQTDTGEDQEIRTRPCTNEDLEDVDYFAYSGGKGIDLNKIASNYECVEDEFEFSRTELGAKALRIYFQANLPATTELNIDKLFFQVWILEK